MSAYHVGPDVRIQTGAYRPLTIASLAANHLLSGSVPWSYHLVNLLLHALASALVVLLAADLGVSVGAASLAGLAFAVHPVHVEAVANVAGRGEILSTTLGLAALIASARGRLVTSAVLLGAALFAKENLVTIFGVVVLREALFPAKARAAAPWARWTGALWPLAAAAVPVAAYLVARLAVLGSLGLAPGSVTSIENPIVGLATVPRVATVLAVFARACSLVVTPVRLSPDYGYAEITPYPSIFAPAPIVGGSLLAALLVLLVVAWRRAPRVAFLVGASLATYAIVSNAFVIIGTVLGDRLLYLPSVFACLLFAIGATAVARRTGRAAATAGATVILLLLAVRSALYIPVWREDATLFAYASRVAPNSVRALGGYGEVLGENGRFEESRRILDRAVTIAPDFIPNRLNRGATALATGDLDVAYADARRVLTLEPGNKAATHLMSGVMERQRQAPSD